MSLLAKADKLCPPKARLLAYKNGRLLTDVEIAKASGLSHKTVQRLSGRKSFRGVRIEVVDSFLAACGIDPLRSRAKVAQLTRMTTYKNGFASARHLRATKNTPVWVKAQQARLIRRFIKLMS